MRIGYALSTPARRFSDSDFAQANVDHVWIDSEKTDRANRAFLIKVDLRRGDVLVLLVGSHIGHGAEAKLMRDAVEGKGATIEVCPLPEKEKRPRGAPSTFLPSEEDDRVLRAMWHDPVSFTTDNCLRTAEARVGRRPSRFQMIRRYGSRGARGK